MGWKKMYQEKLYLGKEFKVILRIMKKNVEIIMIIRFIVSASVRMSNGKLWSIWINLII